MSLVPRGRSVAGSRHLDDLLSAYADRNLPAATLLACDRHVAICPGCRDAVDGERRLLQSLRSSATPPPPSRLEMALLDLAVCAMPDVPTRRPSPISVVGRSAPPLHRSPVRAAMLASLAAGASAAAAWSVGVSGVGPAGGSLPIVRLPSAGVTASSSFVSGSETRATSFLTPGAANIAASTGFNPTFRIASTASAPVTGSRPGLSNVGGRRGESVHD
jgi:anti-sigma factor RsiW